MHTRRNLLASVAALFLAASVQAADPSDFDWAAHGFGPGPAGNEGDNGYIGIFADPLGTQPCASIPAGQTSTLYLFAFLNGATANGITGAEFRIAVTHPEGYQFLYQAPPGSPIVIGNPFDLTPNDPWDEAGMNIAFSCQTTSRIALGTILVLNVSGGPTELQVRKRNGPLNPNSNCALFTDCIAPGYAQQCMAPCTIDATAASIVSRAWINDPACGETRDCLAACAPEHCVSITATASQPRCAGRPITITATVRNCSSVAEDIDVYVAYELAGSFQAVPPGEAVTASRTYILDGCSSPYRRQPVGAVVRSASCDHATGREIAVGFDCTQCEPNRAPDCSGVVASVTELWPADGQLVPITITGFSDPDGDPLLTHLDFVASDESAGIYGSPNCPDAFIDGPLAVRLRAERNPQGNGRIYHINVRAEDPAGLECDHDLEICVPRKNGVPCVRDVTGYLSTLCEPLTGAGAPRSVRVRSITGAGTEVRFSTAAATEARVEVFDIRGRRVASLARSQFAAGEHVLNWDGRDDSGHSVASGIYVFRLTAGGNVETAKAVVMQ